MSHRRHRLVLFSNVYFYFIILFYYLIQYYPNNNIFKQNLHSLFFESLLHYLFIPYVIFLIIVFLFFFLFPAPGCDLLLNCLRNNPKLSILNLSSCKLSGRSAMSLSLFLKRRKADLIQNIWEQSSEDNNEKVRI